MIPSPLRQIAVVFLVAAASLFLAGAAPDATSESAASGPAGAAAGLPVVAHNAAGIVPIPAWFPTPFEVRVSDLGVRGPEPSVGVDSAGRIFFQAFLQTMRSADDGATWQDVTPPTAAPCTKDPMMWLDRETGRVFSDQLRCNAAGASVPATAGITCSWAVWTDSGGDSWEGVNPNFCGPNPEPTDLTFVQHFQKIGTGSVPPGFERDGEHPEPQGYANAVFYSWSEFGGRRSWIDMSLDGGQTFPHQALMLDGGCPAFTGRVRSLPTGTLLVPQIGCNVGVLRSTDFDTWTATGVAGTAGQSSERQTPEVAVDSAGGAYVTWANAGHDVALRASTDDGQTWGTAHRVSPPHVRGTVAPTPVAGSPGRVAVLYYGQDTSDLPAGKVPDATRWHAYLTFSIDALSADPTWVTVQLDDEDPIQVGGIRTITGISGGRNLLEFVDLALTPDGRVVAAYADGCTASFPAGDPCALDPDPTPAQSRDDNGVAAIQLSPGFLLD